MNKKTIVIDMDDVITTGTLTELKKVLTRNS